jgi:hypothetical protein
MVGGASVSICETASALPHLLPGCLTRTHNNRKMYSKSLILRLAHTGSNRGPAD